MTLSMMDGKTYVFVNAFDAIYGFAMIWRHDIASRETEHSYVHSVEEIIRRNDAWKRTTEYKFSVDITSAKKAHKDYEIPHIAWVSVCENQANDLINPTGNGQIPAIQNGVYNTPVIELIVHSTSREEGKPQCEVIKPILCVQYRSI